MKKEVPLNVLKAIEPILPNLTSNKLVVERKDGTLLRIVDADKESAFFYEITGFEMNNVGANNLKVRYKPKNSINVEVFSTLIESKSFEASFKQWLSLVEGYNEVKSVFDDPILKQYTDDFYTEFESADEDADTVSFSLKQQLLLDSALSQVIQVLEEQTTEANKETITEIIEEVEEIQNTVTENTKQETLTKMSRLFAKIQKVGIKVIKHVAPIIEKEIIGAIIKSGVTAAGVGIAGAAATHLLN